MKNILTSCLNVSKDLISTYFPSDFNRLGYVWGKLIFKIAFQLILRELSLTNQYDGKSFSKKVFMKSESFLFRLQADANFVISIIIQ